jgi:uncharacterized protein (DUF1501 family)
MMTPHGVSNEEAQLQRAYVETARVPRRIPQARGWPRVAMFDTTGWDTHANEGGAQGSSRCACAGSMRRWRR